MSNITFNAKCNHVQPDVKSASITIVKTDDSRACGPKLGYIRIQSKHTFTVDWFFDLIVDREMDFLITPMITTTDEKLRSLNPKR
jgi:hypothetical protein